MNSHHRSLHLGHFAFMRSVVQGIDGRSAWDRYLINEGDFDNRRAVSATSTWIRQQLAAAAKREAKPALARLLRIDFRVSDHSVHDPQRFAKQNLPTLADFVAVMGLDDFSENEQIAAFEQHYGKSDRRSGRRARLIAKQLEALRWLEGLTAQTPRAGDSVHAWFAESIATRLEAAGFATLELLCQRINGVGRGWFRPVKGLGAVKAQRIVDWLSNFSTDGALTLGVHIHTRRRALSRAMLDAVVPPATAIVPLEKLLIPVSLNGEQGAYRAPRQLCLIAANNDYEAITTWLRSKRGVPAAQITAKMASQNGNQDPDSVAWWQYLSHTQRAYRKEAERFLLWAIIERKKALSSMTHEDCQAYLAFLETPQPPEKWCAPRTIERWSAQWRPFEGALSVSTRQHALTILNNLYDFLFSKSYLIGNPMKGIRLTKSAKAPLDAGRSLTKKQWQYVVDYSNSLPQSFSNNRLRFMLHILYCTGLRLSELCSARLGDLAYVEYPANTDDEQSDDDTAGWELSTVGKGGKPRTVPIPFYVITLLANHLRDRAIAFDAKDCVAGIDVKYSARYVLGLSPNHTENCQLRRTADATGYRLLKEFFACCATQLEKTGNQRDAEKLKHASTHWLRHTHATHALANGASLTTVRDNLGHASVSTTSGYLNTEKQQRMREMLRSFEMSI